MFGFSQRWTLSREIFHCHFSRYTLHFVSPPYCEHAEVEMAERSPDNVAEKGQNVGVLKFSSYLNNWQFRLSKNLTAPSPLKRISRETKPWYGSKIYGSCHWVREFISYVTLIVQILVCSSTHSMILLISGGAILILRKANRVWRKRQNSQRINS